MPGPRSSTSLWRRLLGVALWMLLATGLFAMHGLGTHGAGSHPETAQPLNASVSVHLTGQPSLHSASDGQESASTSPGVQRSATSDPASPGSMSELISMCLAIVAGVLAGLAAVLLRHLERRPLARVARSAKSFVIVGRDPDPPCLVRLSVMRC